jgi:hypothetical protein
MKRYDDKTGQAWEPLDEFRELDKEITRMRWEIDDFNRRMNEPKPIIIPIGFIIIGFLTGYIIGISV